MDEEVEPTKTIKADKKQIVQKMRHSEKDRDRD